MSQPFHRLRCTFPQRCAILSALVPSRVASVNCLNLLSHSVLRHETLDMFSVSSHATLIPILALTE